MDSVSTHTNSIDKKTLLKELIDVIVTSLENEKITLEQMRESSDFILQHTEHIEALPDYISFLQTLASKWDIFKEIANKYQDQTSEESEKLVLNKLQSYFKAN